MYDTWGIVAKKPKGHWRLFPKHTKSNCASGGRRARRRWLPEEGPAWRQEARLGRRRTWLYLLPGRVGLFGLVNKPVLVWLPPLHFVAADHLSISIEGCGFSGADDGSPAPFSSRGLLYEIGSLSPDLGRRGLFWASAAGRPAAHPGSQDHPPPPPLPQPGIWCRPPRGAMRFFGCWAAFPRGCAWESTHVLGQP